jgi:hypothetical protein
VERGRKLWWDGRSCGEREEGAFVAKDRRPSKKAQPETCKPATRHPTPETLQVLTEKLVQLNPSKKLSPAEVKMGPCCVPSLACASCPKLVHGAGHYTVLAWSILMSDV